MTPSRIAAALLLCGAFMLADVAHALSDDANKMCSPYIPDCPCNQVLNPNRNQPGQPKCIAGKSSDPKNKTGYTNTHGCPVSETSPVCKDETQGHTTVGICVAQNLCEGKITDGKPIQKTDVPVNATPCLSDTGDICQTPPVQQPSVSTLEPPPDTEVPPSRDGEELNRLLFDPTPIADSANRFEKQITDAEQKEGFLQNLWNKYFSGGGEANAGLMPDGKTVLTPEITGTAGGIQPTDMSSLHPRTVQTTIETPFASDTFGRPSVEPVAPGSSECVSWLCTMRSVFGGGPPSVPAAGTFNREALGDPFAARTTFYGPGAGGTVQGGFETSRPGLDGQRIPTTLDDVRMGNARAVTLATAPENYGNYYDLGAVTYKSPIDGKIYTGDPEVAARTGATYSENLARVTGYSHDTGSAFRAGYCARWGTCNERLNKFDIAVGDFRGWSGGQAYKFLVSQGQEFGGNRLNEFQQVAGLPTSNPALTAWGTPSPAISSVQIASTDGGIGYSPSWNAFESGSSPIPYTINDNPYTREVYANAVSSGVPLAYAKDYFPGMYRPSLYEQADDASRYMVGYDASTAPIVSSAGLNFDDLAVVPAIPGDSVASFNERFYFPAEGSVPTVDSRSPEIIAAENQQRLDRIAQAERDFPTAPPDNRPWWQQLLFPQTRSITPDTPYQDAFEGGPQTDPMYDFAAAIPRTDAAPVVISSRDVPLFGEGDWARVALAENATTPDYQTAYDMFLGQQNNTPLPTVRIDRVPLDALAGLPDPTQRDSFSSRFDALYGQSSVGGIVRTVSPYQDAFEGGPLTDPRFDYAAVVPRTDAAPVVITSRDVPLFGEGDWTQVARNDQMYRSTVSEAELFPGSNLNTWSHVALQENIATGRDLTSETFAVAGVERGPDLEQPYQAIPVTQGPIGPVASIEGALPPPPEPAKVDVSDIRVPVAVPEVTGEPPFLEVAPSQPAISLESCSGGICGRGNGGESVQAIQKFLNTQGHSLTEDGIYGRNTESAVRQFQRSQNLSPDGIVGAQTVARMNEIASPPAPQPQQPAALASSFDETGFISADQFAYSWEPNVPADTFGTTRGIGGPITIEDDQLVPIVDVPQPPVLQNDASLYGEGYDASVFAEQEIRTPQQTEVTQSEEDVPLPRPRPSDIPSAPTIDPQVQRQAAINALRSNNQTAIAGLQALQGSQNEAQIAAGMRAANRMYQQAVAIGDTTLAGQIGGYIKAQNQLVTAFEKHGRSPLVYPYYTRVLSLGQSVTAAVNNKYRR